MRLLKLFLLFSIFTTPVLAKELAPIWQAQKRLSTDKRAWVTIAIEDGWANGKFESETVRAPLKNGNVDLEFSKGKFKGLYDEKLQTLHGHWVQPPTGRFINTPFATPITFKNTAHGFIGDVEILQESLTLYMLLGEKDEKGIKVKFINPELNGGRFFKFARLQIDGDKAVLLAQMRWQDKPGPLAKGSYNAKDQRIILNSDFFFGDMVFQAAGDDSDYWPQSKGAMYQYQSPAKYDDDWQVSNAKEQGVDTKKLTALVQSINDNPPTDATMGAVHAVLVARHGKLVLEEYFNGHDRHSLHDTRSASKSLTGTLVGMAQYAGVPISLNDGLYQVMSKRYKGLPVDELKLQITLKDVLTMSTGLDCDDRSQNSPGQEDTMQNQSEQPDWFRYMLDLKMVAKPGSKAAYCSGGINLAGGMLTQKANMWMPLVVDKFFARPLGIKRYHINLMADGSNAYSGGGLRITARDFLKLGQLMMDSGQWQGKQLISKDYVKQALTPIQQMSEQGYGLGWWRKTYRVDGKEKTVFYAGGNGGQQIIGDPDTGLLAVFFGGAYSTKGTYYARDVLTPQYLLNSVTD